MGGVGGGLIFLLAACSDDITAPAYTVGAADNAIVLSAGINTGSVASRAAADPNHANHEALKEHTVVSLRVDGKWLGHSPENVQRSTQGTIASIVADTDEKHRNIDFIPANQPYWDDYGTADPDNMPSVANNGRDRGLDIFAAAVDGVTTALTGITNPSVVDAEWTAYPWKLTAGEITNPLVIDQSTSGWADFDLLTSNNVRHSDTPAVSNAYKFAQRNDGKLLEFTHAMSKISVQLTAGKGFPEYTTDPANAHFASAPEVTLLGFNCTGKVNIVEGTSTAYNAAGDDATAANTARADFKMHPLATERTHMEEFDALVFPGNTFTDATNIVKIKADDNIYYVTAKQINDAMKATDGHEGSTFHRGYHYILKVTLNKTEIHVSATVEAWKTIEAADVAPVIHVGTSYTGTGLATPDGVNNFSFYRAESFPYKTPTPDSHTLTGYSENYSGNANGFFAPEATLSGTLGTQAAWTFDTPLYWPNHKTHYHFRGVWPKTVTTNDGKVDGILYPRVKMNTEGNAQVIDIHNVAYTPGSFPSDLLIGMPEITTGTNCANTDHTAVDQSVYGICATEGVITLNFRYAMSQVEVNLSSSDVDKIDHVNVDANTKVEIVGLATDGYVRLGDRVVVPSTTTADYTIDPVTGAVNELKRHSAVVPQLLPYTTPGAETNARFKITVTNTDDTTDIYYADIAPIKERGKTTLVAPGDNDDAKTDATQAVWKSGEHYIYHLVLTKTLIKASATITDWTTVEADQNVWF